jgi:hypothetical protein
MPDRAAGRDRLRRRLGWFFAPAGLLKAEQLKAFDEQGYLFLPNCFSEDEVIE